MFSKKILLVLLLLLSVALNVYLAYLANRYYTNAQYLYNEMLWDKLMSQHNIEVEKRDNTLTWDSFEEEKKIKYHRKKDQLFKQLPNVNGEIIFIGDSHIDGFELTEFFKDPLIKNRGISGDYCEGVLQRMNEVVESKPDKIFIMIGVNDIIRGNNLDTLMRDYKNILDAISKASLDSKVYVQSILPVSNDQVCWYPDCNEKIREINDRLESLCADRNAIYVDLYTSMSLDEELNSKYSLDGLHINGLGYQVWTEKIKSFVSEE